MKIVNGRKFVSLKELADHLNSGKSAELFFYGVPELACAWADTRAKHVQATGKPVEEGVHFTTGDTPAEHLLSLEGCELIEKFATLTATRQLQPEELAEIPARSDTPLMEFSITSGENTRTLTVDLANDVADIYYVYDENDTVYTVTQTSLAGLCKDPKDLYKAQTLTDKTIDDVAAMQVGDLGFTQTDGTWTLTDDPDYDLDQDAVKKMANTVCGVKTDWTITAPQADSAYGLDTPDVTVTATFTDGSELTVRFGNLADADTTLCYLASSGAPDLVYEASADYKNAFAVTRESLQATEATAESAAEEDTIVAEHPVGGKDDYADADQEE